MEGSEWCWRRTEGEGRKEGEKETEENKPEEGREGKEGSERGKEGGGREYVSTAQYSRQLNTGQ